MRVDRADKTSMLACAASVPRLTALALACLLVALLHADLRRLGARLLAVPRVAVLALVIGLSTATIAVAAEQERPKTGAPARAPAPVRHEPLVVPDVRNQAFVFAKGMLEDAGFAWRVTGRVGGYAANRVVSQAPLPGTRVVDNGAPTIVLRLAANRAYVERGTPENIAPYAGAPVELAAAPGR